MFENGNIITLYGIQYIRLDEAQAICLEIIERKDKEIQRLSNELYAKENCVCSYPIDSCNGTSTCTYCGKKLSMVQLLQISQRQKPVFNSGTGK